jgi:hypothetical protein
LFTSIGKATVGMLGMAQHAPEGRYQYNRGEGNKQALAQRKMDLSKLPS